MTLERTLPPISGLLLGWVGVEVDFHTLASDATASALELTLRDVSGSDVTASVTDGTSSVSATIPAGARYALAAVAQPFSAGAVLKFRVDAAGADAMNLSGNLHLLEAAGNVPSSGPGLITAAEFFAANQIGAPTQAQTDFVERMIEASSERIRNYCARYFNRARYSEQHFYPGLVYSRDSEAVSVSSADADGLTVATIVDPDSGYIGRDRGDGVPHGWHGTKVLTLTYDAGWTVIPADIRDALYRAILGQLRQFDASGGVTGDEGSIKAISYTGAGRVEYQGASASGEWDDADDWIASLPLSLFARYRNLAEEMGISQSRRISSMVPL